MGCGSSVAVSVPPSKQEKQDPPRTAQFTTTFEDHNDGKINNNGKKLPRPQPPATTKKELLDKNPETVVSMAKLEEMKNTAPSTKQDLTNFTSALMSESEPVLNKTIRFSDTENSASPNHSDLTSGNQLANTPSNYELKSNSAVKTNGNLPSGPTAQQTQPDSSMHENRSSFQRSALSNQPLPDEDQLPLQPISPNVQDQVQRALEEHLKAKEKEDEMRNLDKLRQQQSLKEKLKLRSERKKQKLEATSAAQQASIPEVQRESNALSADKITKSGDLSFNMTSLEGSLHPTAPVDRKEVLYREEENISLFRDLESHAVNMEKVSSASVTFANLMEELLIHQLSDLEKVRIIFHWVTAQNLNEINFPANISEDTPLGFLYAIKLDKKTYAGLFERMCSAAGLHAKLVTGFLKGVGYYPDHKFQPNDSFRGSWNAVLIDQQWRLIDTNWGARHVTEEDDLSHNEWHTEYKYEEHYFLTDPDQMIITHFPDEPDWQLLPKPYTLSEFENSAKLWPLFFKLKLELCSHPAGVITTNDEGYVKIVLKVPSSTRYDAKFRGELRTRSKKKEIDGFLLHQYMLHYSNNDEEVFEFFLPAAGQYLFKIFGLSKKYSDENTFTNVCLYQINCQSVKQIRNNSLIQPPLPIANGQYGPYLGDVGLLAVSMSHPGPVVECDQKGEAKVVFTLTESWKNASFTQELCDVKHGSTSALNGWVLHALNQKGNSKEVIFHIKAPTNGNYLLTLYHNWDQFAEAKNTFSAFCQYLVVSRMQVDSNKGNPFPEIPNGRLGSIQPDFNNANLELVSGSPLLGEWRSGIMKTDAHGECRLLFKHQEPLTFVANLTSSNSTSSLDEYCAVETTGSYTAITVRAPVQLCGQVSFALRIYAALLDQTQNIPSVFTALVIPASVHPVKPLPQAPTRSWGPSGLRFYSHGIQNVRFQNSSSELVTFKTLPKDVQASAPCRIYQGGDDFEMVMSTTRPLQFKAKLIPLDDNAKKGENSSEDFVFFGNADAYSTCLQLRFAHDGLYSLVVYGSELDDTSGQLVPLMYVLVDATAISTCTIPFPKAFGVWTSSAHTLFSPNSIEILRNKENFIKVYLGRFQKPSSSEVEWSVVPFQEVALFNGTQRLPPVSPSPGLYEWNYVPGPGETIVGVIVKSDENSMTFSMQFKVV
ncbi:uncharacterized protein LOC143469916 isoform X2 [Clavelina lepadiformis]|uniref:uncharacterized protein LOC143469916 isoform X2 n=1 Tax=Clavelina lepadiformis TaxID=159417 RepID=UPI004042A9A6